MCTHAGGVEWSAGEVHDEEEEGRVHTLGQPDIFGPAKGFRSRVGGRVPLARPALQAYFGSCSCSYRLATVICKSRQAGLSGQGGGKGYKYTGMHQDRRKGAGSAN